MGMITKHATPSSANTAAHNSASGITAEQWYQRFSLEVDKTVAAVDYLTEKQVERFREACFFMYEEHKAQRRRSGEPYAFHPLAVAGLLAEVNFDVDTLIAGLLHDVIEDVENPDGSKKWTRDTLAAVPFVGTVVADIVEGVTKIEKIDHITPEANSRERREAHTIVKTILATSRDIRVIMVKLADRLHNLRTMDAMRPSSQRKKARETLAVYAPIAGRLGMETLRLRLRELSYRYAYPRLYQRAYDQLQASKPKLKKTNKQVAKELTKLLETAGVQVIKVSILEPLVQHAILDLKRLGNAEAIEYRRLMRVVVKEENDCYWAMGVLHKRFRYINNTIRDHIAQVKENGYRSLDTQLFGRKGVQYDCVIRTEEMHTLAQTGAAGSFLKSYFDKTGEVPDSFDHHYKTWFNNLVDIEKNLDSADDFYNEFKDDLRPNEIAVYTPRGDVRFYPEGATAVDFAYGVHTELGDSASLAIINGHYTPLNTKLKDGDKIRIVKSKTARPDPAWMRFAVTPRARHAIRHYFNHLEEDNAIAVGEQLLSDLLQQFERPSPDDWDSALMTELLAHYDQIETIEDLYSAIGRGKRLPSNVVFDLDQILESRNDDFEAEDVSTFQEKFLSQSQLFAASAPSCTDCLPVPGDDVVLKFTPSEGMMIHHGQCQTLDIRHDKSSEYHYFNWHPDEKRHKANISIIADDLPGVVTSLSQLISQHDSNIAQMNFTQIDEQHSRISLILRVFSSDQLERIMAAFIRQPYAIKVERLLHKNIA